MPGVPGPNSGHLPTPALWAIASENLAIFRFSRWHASASSSPRWGAVRFSGLLAPIPTDQAKASMAQSPCARHTLCSVKSNMIDIVSV